MLFRAVPPGLRETLGDEATGDLVDLLDIVKDEWRDDLLTVERFEHRLMEETSTIRLEMGQMEGRLRQDMAKLGADLRVEIHAECGRTRVEIIRWSFLFWIGQIAAISGLLSFLLRSGGR